MNFDTKIPNNKAQVSEVDSQQAAMKLLLCCEGQSNASAVPKRWHY